MTRGRQESASDEIGRTDVSPRLARLLVLLFVATILAVSLAQLLGAREDGDGLGALCREALEIPVAGLHTATTCDAGPLDRLLAGNREMLRRITAYEDRLAEGSIVGRWLRPPLRALLAGRMKAGTEQCYCGRDGWIFFRPAVDHLTGRGFLEPGHLRARIAAASEWSTPPRPDPRPAILSFAGQLAERGITLIVMPVPVKASIHPEHFTARFDPLAGVLRNPSFAPLVAELTAAGVAVYDPAPILAQGRDSGTAQYLETDSHWRPEAMERVARGLARYIETQVELPPGWAPATVTDELTITNTGDLAAMLELPRGDAAYPPETVTVNQVLYQDDTLWRSEATADVLVLGDSFSNIYSLAAMGWGQAAGLVEHLGHALGRPVDAILRNDNAAFAGRLQLSAELARGHDRLAGKRVVVWQLSERELSSGDWRELPLALGDPEPGRFVVPPQGETWLVTARIAAMGPVPRPRSAPYADYIVALHLEDLEVLRGDDSIRGAEALVFVRAMEDFEWRDGALLRAGQNVRLRLQSWTDVADELGQIDRGEIYDDELLFQEPCWGEVAWEDEDELRQR